MQQDTLSWLVWGGTRAQGAAAAQAECKLQVPAYEDKWKQAAEPRGDRTGALPDLLDIVKWCCEDGAKT